MGYKRNASNNGWISVKDGSSYSFSQGNCQTYGKDNSALRSAGYIDTTGNLVAAHDAATAHLGAPWRMPTAAEFSALVSNCDATWTQRNGVHGRLVTGRGTYASKSIFLPAAGYGHFSRLVGTDSYGSYWFSTPDSDCSNYARYLTFDSSDFGRGNRSRFCGRPVRPVRGLSNPSPSMSPPKIGGSAHTADDSLAKAKREMEEKIAAQREDKLYCVIDLSGGPNAKHYPVTYLNSAPKTGWSDEYKTTKLVLRRIGPGSFKMGGAHNVTLTKSYYMGVFEVTQKQWERVMGTMPSFFYNGRDMRPVERVSFVAIRGATKGWLWPTSAEVDEMSFLGKLRDKAVLNFDLPTEAQWEYACRAGSESHFSNGSTWSGNDKDEHMSALGRYRFNGGWNFHRWGESGSPESKVGLGNGTAVVGSYEPNAWGFYDMHGNVYEWCLDWGGSLKYGVDPLGEKKADGRIIRGGSWKHGAVQATSSHRETYCPYDGCKTIGFRLAIQPK